MRPLFESLPLNQAMSVLVRPQANERWIDLAEDVAVEAPLELQAAIWLYVDDLGRSHEISQGIAGPVGAYWHGIMHRREGDFWNAKYWLRQAEPVTIALAGSLSESGAGLPHSIFDPLSFVDAVEKAVGCNPEELVELQRREWMALFTYCAERVGVVI